MATHQPPGDPDASLNAEHKALKEQTTALRREHGVKLKNRRKLLS
jgi:hypothetical protein